MHFYDLAKTCLLLLLCFGSFGCKQTIQMKIDLDNLNDFYGNPFPTVTRQQANGQIDLTGFPRPQHALTQHYAQVIEEDILGYTTIMPIYLPLTGPLDTARLPANDWDYANNNAPIQVIDIDPNSSERGRRFPLRVGMTKRRDSYRPEHLLQLLPTLGINLKPNTRYAAIVTNQIPVAENATLLQHPTLTTLLNGELPEGQYAAKTASGFSALNAQLAQDNLPTESIIAATVWKTGDPAAPLLTAANAVAQWPAPQPIELEPFIEYDDYCVLKGEWDVPGFQQGTPPFAFQKYGGAIEYDDQGSPLVQYSRRAPFVVALPKRPMPASGFPLVMYNHGTGGDSHQVYTRGKTLMDGTQEIGRGPSEVLAQRGWASSGMGGHMALEHLGKLGTVDGYMAYNFLNPRAMRDNFVQMVLERVLFRNLLNSLQLDPHACAGTTLPPAHQHIFFNTHMQAYMGQSLGSYLTGMLTAADPNPVQGSVFTGAGGGWIEFVFGPTDPINLQYLVEIAALQLSPLEHLDVWHPVPMAAELAMGVANNLHYVERILQRPTKTAPHVLVIEGHNDHQVPENIQRPLVTALGVELAGDEVGTQESDMILPYLLMNGRQHHAYPVKENVSVSNQGLRTAVVVRYEEDATPGVDGHYVSFQLDAAKHQYACFFEQLLHNRSPWIIEGEFQTGACP